MVDLEPSLAALAEPLPAAATERVVVFRYDKIGDLIVSSPVFRAIKAAHPNAAIVLVCSSYNRSVLENMPEIDRIVVYSSKAGWRDKLRFALALRRLKPTTTFVLSPNSDGYWLGWLSGARKRAGVIMSYRRMQRILAPVLLTASVVIDKARLNLATDRSFHQSEITLRLAAACGFPRPRTVHQSAPTSAADQSWAARWGASTGPRILLHLGVTWKACGLDEAAMVALVERIYADFPDASVLLTAGPAEASYRDAFSSRFPDVLEISPQILASPDRLPRALLFSDLSFGCWSALIASATVVVTPDTGAVHLASAHQRPVVAVYAPDRFHSMTSMFGPWEVPHRALRGGEAGAVSAEVLTSLRALLDEVVVPVADAPVREVALADIVVPEVVAAEAALPEIGLAGLALAGGGISP